MDYENLTAITKREIGNSLGRLAKGSLLTITGHKRGRLNIQSKRCICCGVSIYITIVEPRALHLEDTAENQQQLDWIESRYYITRYGSRYLITPDHPEFKPKNERP